MDATAHRAIDEGRDLTDRERQLSHQDRDELVALKDADEIRAMRRQQADDIDRQAAERSHLIGQAVESHQRGNRLSPLAISQDNLDALELARREYRSMSVIETRSALSTTKMGTAVEYAANGLLAPNTLWRLSGIPTSEPPLGVQGTVPQFTLPAATALVSEGNAHAEYDDVTPDTVTLKRTGAWSDLTSEAFISTSLAEISGAHARIIARDIDLALVGKLEQTPSGTFEDVDEVLATVAAEAASDTSRLWIVGTPASIAALAGTALFAATNAADIGSYASTYGAARLYPTPTATESQLTVFYPGAFRAFATPLASATVVDPTTGSQRFGQWQLFGVGQTLAGAALTISDGGS